MDAIVSVTAKCELRAVIRFLHAKKWEPINIYRQLCEVNGPNCMTVHQVRFRCREFAKGRTDAHDEQRSGRPSLSDEVVALFKAIRAKIGGSRLGIFLSVSQISADSVHKIVTEKLGFNKVCARWVPHMLTAEHKEKRVDLSRKFLNEFANNGDEFLDCIVRPE